MTALKTTLQEGDILSASWGYDQTNVDFYKVLGFTPSGMVRLVQVATRTQRDDGGPITYVVPGDREIGEPFVRKNRDGWVRITSYSWAGPWSGKPKYQTGANWGH